MTLDKYKYFVEKINNEFGSLLKTTQEELLKSKSKKKDFEIVCNFYSKIYNEKFGEYFEIFTDCNSMLPMPESVGKQLAHMLFDFSNLNPLMDLAINEGFY